MSLALYRKYRPRTFAELIGQEHVTEPLSQALRSGRLNHAYLFSGPRGCGKTSSARILARSLNCEQGPTPDPCGECESCRALGTDGPGSIDVIEIDAASHGGVDDARDLRERAFFTPVAGRYKIYVIDEAHMVSSAGFNALLKLVEEPPEFVKFVFATTEPEKVLPTIKSRTHHYPFRLIPPSVLRPYLEQLCAAEGVAVEPAVFPLVVRAGGGSVRDSLSVLDQLISGAGVEGVTYARAAALLGVTDAALIDELCDALAAGDGASMFATVDRVAEAGHDARRFAADLLERLRDLMILQQVPDATAKGLLDVPADQRERMEVHASQLGLATLSRCADIVHNGLVEMRGTASPRLLLELICARMLLPGADDSPGGVLHRLERMERRLGASGDAPASAPPASVPPASAAPPAGGEAPPARALAAPAPVSPPAAADGAPPGLPAHPAADGAPPGPAAHPAAAPPAGRQAATPTMPQGQPPASAASVAGAPMNAAPVAEPRPTGAAAPPAAAAPAAAHQGGGAGQAAVLDAAAIRRVWEEIITTVGRGSKRAAAVVREASVRDVEGNTIVLLFQHAVHANMLASVPQPLLDAVGEVLGGQWQVRCEARDGGRGKPGASTPGAAGHPAPPRPAYQADHGQGGTAGSYPGDSGDTPGAGHTDPASDGDAGADLDWPEPARPGGVAPPPVADSGGGAGDGQPAGLRGRDQAAPPGAGPLERDRPAGDLGTVAGRAQATPPVATTSVTSAAAAPPDPPATVPGARASGITPGGGVALSGAAQPAGTAPGAATTTAAAPAPRTAPALPAAAGPVAATRRGNGVPARPASPASGSVADDDVDEVTDARADPLASGQQALKLLQQTLGAERIGEVRP